MDFKPFDPIILKQIDQLAKADRELLEAIVLAYVAEIRLQRHNGIRTAPAGKPEN
jgi:hypothetical protein